MSSHHIEVLAAQIVRAVAPSIETFADQLAIRGIRPAPVGITRYEFENLMAMRRGYANQPNGDESEIS
jgi:hypothetical protein